VQAHHKKIKQNIVDEPSSLFDSVGGDERGTRFDLLFEQPMAIVRPHVLDLFKLGFERYNPVPDFCCLKGTNDFSEANYISRACL
jgi:hypothetical protein